MKNWEIMEVEEYENRDRKEFYYDRAKRLENKSSYSFPSQRYFDSLAKRKKKSKFMFVINMLIIIILIYFGNRYLRGSETSFNIISNNLEYRFNFIVLKKINLIEFYIYITNNYTTDNIIKQISEYEFYILSGGKELWRKKYKYQKSNILMRYQDSLVLKGSLSLKDKNILENLKKTKKIDEIGANILVNKSLNLYYRDIPISL